MRRATIVLALLAAVVFPASAFAVTPVNSQASGAAPLPVPPLYLNPSPGQPYPIPPGLGSGGWEDATVPDGSQPPSCVGATQQTYNALWYSVTVPEPSVLTVQVSTSTTDPTQYQPVVTVLSSDLTKEYACGRAGSDSETSPTATASSYLDAQTYLIRVASVTKPPTTAQQLAQAPTLFLSVRLRDVTPPAIAVQIPAKIVGTGKKYTFNPSNSSDLGSGIDWGSASWLFYDGGVKTPETNPAATSPEAAAGSYAWRTSGFHRVDLTLDDVAGNASTYTFFVYVHSYVMPKVVLSVSVPLPGASSIRLVLKHNLPINVRLVVFQGGKLLRLIPAKLVKGKSKSKLVIALRTRVKRKGGEVTISGMASTLGTYPNSVALPTCAVDPVKGTGKCA
jgi:hypothetical protein